MMQLIGSSGVFHGKTIFRNRTMMTMVMTASLTATTMIKEYSDKGTINWLQRQHQ